VQNPNVLSIADFSQSSRNKRLYIIDLKNNRLVFQTYVSHGKNSGGDIATSFSNVNNSFKSVLGFLVTADTYTGSNGYSLKFQGMESGINDLVNFRSIVVHGSRYVNEKRIETDGRAVNSLGCPAVPMAQSRPIIETIKGGSVYFIYHPDEFYAASSPILNAQLGFTLFLPITNPFSGSDTLAPALPLGTPGGQ
jgi:L,D-transpeptidase catalytic domain